MITIKKQNLFTIKRDNGDLINTLKIGKGFFTTAYKDVNSEDVYLFCKEYDWAKDILIEAWDKETKTLPPVIYLGDTKTKRVFTMPYIETISAKLNPEAWNIMKELEKTRVACWDRQRRKSGYDNNNFQQRGYQISYETIEEADVPEYIKEELNKLLSSMANYGSEWVFEFSKKNIGIKDGIIQFRDCCFDMGTILGKHVPH